MARRRLVWLALVLVFVAVLAVGSRSGSGPATLDSQVLAVAKTVRCPTCESQSVADSKAPASEAIRIEIRDQLAAGRTPAEVRAFLVGRFGSDILLKPEASGTAGLVWAIPVVVFVLAGAGLALAFVRWKGSDLPDPTEQERAAVDAALRDQR
jgi:cytochrome c-type biogenesis protein CcmH